MSRNSKYTDKEARKLLKRIFGIDRHRSFSSSMKNNVIKGKPIMVSKIRTEYDPYDDEEYEFDIAYKQWSSSDGTIFFPIGKTVRKLQPGVYEISTCQQGLYFEKIPVRTEGLIKFPDTKSESVVEEVQKFWDREEIFRKYGLTYKRGIILYGPPGSGKSCTVQLIMADVVKRGGIVIEFNRPDLFIDGLRKLRKIQPDTPVVAVMEDIDSLLEIHNESEILNILDGVNEVDKVVFLACPSPETLILKSDLTWVRADSLQEGDCLIAFDDEGPDRRYRTAKVNSCPIVERECYRVTTDQGTVVVSEKHPFLIRLGNRPYEWRAVEDLRSGNRIAFMGKPWEVENSRDAGYLAGQYDGEGTLNFSYNPKTGSTGFRAIWVQAVGDVVDNVKCLLSERNFDIGEYIRTPKEVNVKGDPYKTKSSLYVRGGKWESLRLLGSIRPNRLLDHPRLSDAWENCRLCCKRAKVLSIEPIGKGPVVALDTTTNTFIGEGFLQHNTTNYPDKLGHRIINRPSRFDKRFRIGFPTAESRKVYFEHLIGKDNVQGLDIDLDRWVKDTDKFSIAHLKELFVAVVILDDKYEDAIKTLGMMKEEVKDKDYQEPMGFGSDLKGAKDPEDYD